MDLPVITEATNEYYRNIYADPLLGPIFRGINMIVLRQHVSYFIHQLTMFDSPMTQRQLEYLRKVHQPLIVKHGITQEHYDLMVSYLVDAMRTNGAEENHLTLVQVKLQPLRDLFPPPGTSICGTVVLPDQQQQRLQAAPCAGSSSSFTADRSGSFLYDQGSSIYGQQSEPDEKEDKVAHHAGAHTKGKFKAWAKRVVKSFSSKH